MKVAYGRYRRTGMDLSTVLAGLGIEHSRGVIEPYWHRSDALFPADGPDLVEAGFIERECAYASTPDAAKAQLLEGAQRLRECPPLLHLLWHCERLLYEERDYDAWQFGRWPTFEAQLGELAGTFYLLVGLAAIPRTREAQQARGVPDEITRDTFSHIDESTAIYRDRHGGNWGLDPRVVFWFRNHTAGELYRLGRLEYMCKPFYAKLHVFRNRGSDEVLALAGDGTKFDPEGYVDTREENDGWTARFEEDDEAVRGCPISPLGVAVNREVELPLSEWRRVLSKGDCVLETHIPAGGGMTPERCRDSMQRALDFFPRYFPERPFKGFGCESWILNPQLQSIYSPESNMVRWQRELYLFPVRSGGRSGLYFIFGEDDVDPATAPRDTSLRRAVLDHLAEGGRFISGGMFMLAEDFPRFGTQPYRSHWPPRVLR